MITRVKLTAVVLAVMVVLFGVGDVRSVVTAGPGATVGPAPGLLNVTVGTTSGARSVGGSSNVGSASTDVPVSDGGPGLAEPPDPNVVVLPVLEKLEIFGPSEVADEWEAKYTAIATFEDGNEVFN